MSVVICPTVTAEDLHEYRRQMETILPFAERVHIDVMDGDFAPSRSPAVENLWLPHELTCDIHLMYRRPMEALPAIVKQHPQLVIIQAEADVHHMHFAAELHKNNIQAGLALLADTPVERVTDIIHSFDQVLIFSGKLGYHGGQANLHLLKKVLEVRQLHPEAEIAWDGGINDQNARLLIGGGVTVLNVGGFIQKSKTPEAAYATLKAITG